MRVAPRPVGCVLGQVPCVERGSVRGLAEPAAGLLLSTRHPPGAARAPPRHTEGQRRTACSLRPAARCPADRGHGVGDDGRGAPRRGDCPSPTMASLLQRPCWKRAGRGAPRAFEQEEGQACPPVQQGVPVLRTAQQTGPGRRRGAHCRPLRVPPLPRKC